MMAWAGPESELDCFGGSGDAEQGEPGGVEDLDDVPDPLEQGAGGEGHQPGGSGGGQVAPVAERGGWSADQQVSDDAAGEGDDQGENQHAEEVETGFHGRESAAEAEHEGSD